MRQLIKWSLPLVAIMMLVVWGCDQNSTTNTSSSKNLYKIDDACGTTTWTLWGGQTINTGTVTVSNDADNVYVTYTAADTWTISQIHLWVGSDLANVPSNNQGIPVPGHFPYNLSFDPAVATYTVTIPFSTIGIPDVTQKCGANLYVVAHAVVSNGSQTETAFGGSVPVNVGTPGRWWYYGSYSICCDFGTPVMGICQTAFAKGGWVFTTDAKSNPERLPSLNLTKNRWGWAINVKGDGTRTYDIWAGAGLNKTSNGTKVGTLTVTVSGSTVTVSYALSTGYTMEEAHIYCGDFKPTTLAPGQYGHTAYFDPHSGSYSATFNVSDTNGDGLWIIAHAVACY